MPFLFVAGCKAAPPPAAKASPTYTLRNVTLPDLSQAAPSVQQQLRDSYAALQKKVDGAATPADELGAAYGQLGMLLLTAGYRGDAESALLNAQTFSPRDSRWPYHLGELYTLKGDAAAATAAFARAQALQPAGGSQAIQSPNP